MDKQKNETQVSITYSKDFSLFTIVAEGDFSAVPIEDVLYSIANTIKNSRGESNDKEEAGPGEKERSGEGQTKPNPDDRSSGAW